MSIDVFRRRLQKIGITVEFATNFPWVYMTKVNGKTVTEKYHGEHGFTVAFLKRTNEVSFNDLETIFKTIRKYV